MRGACRSAGSVLGSSQFGRRYPALFHGAQVGPDDLSCAAPECCAPQLPRQFGEGEHGVFACDIVPKTLELFLKRSPEDGPMGRSKNTIRGGGGELVEVRGVHGTAVNSHDVICSISLFSLYGVNRPLVCSMQSVHGRSPMTPQSLVRRPEASPTVRQKWL